MIGPRATPKSYFDDLYRDDPDPWSFDSSWYERRKYALTLAALPNSQYRRALEPGCANGALTSFLAARCGELHAYDFVGPAVSRASQRMAAENHVTVSRASFPDYWPSGQGDLVVLSEVVYYLDPDALQVAGERLQKWLEPQGTLITVHYTDATNYPIAGSEVSAWVDGLGGFERRSTLVDELFELAVWRRNPA